MDGSLCHSGQQSMALWTAVYGVMDSSLWHRVYWLMDGHLSAYGQQSMALWTSVYGIMDISLWRNGQGSMA